MAPWHVCYLVVVVPAELLTGPNELGGEEGHPGEAQVVRVHKYILHEHVRLAAETINNLYLIVVAWTFIQIKRIHQLNTYRVKLSETKI